MIDVAQWKQDDCISNDGDSTCCSITEATGSDVASEELTGDESASEERSRQSLWSSESSCGDSIGGREESSSVCLVVGREDSTSEAGISEVSEACAHNLPDLPCNNVIPLWAAWHCQYMNVLLAPPAYPPAFDVAAGDAWHQPSMPTNCIQGRAAKAKTSSKVRMNADRVPTECQTTLCIRNLPNNCSKEEVLSVINSMGFAESYDFFYLPFDFKKATPCNMGYAFVNFVSNDKAHEFKRRFEGFCDWPLRRSEKKCKISWGDIQGYEANVERWRNSTMLASQPDKYRPSVFEKGVPQEFPASDRWQWS
jgi:hypothetical protein